MRTRPNSVNGEDATCREDARYLSITCASDIVDKMTDAHSWVASDSAAAASPAFDNELVILQLRLLGSSALVVSRSGWNFHSLYELLPLQKL